MKPKPFASLNHFTVPVVRAIVVLLSVVVKSEYRNNAVRADPQLLVIALTMGTFSKTDPIFGDVAKKKGPCDCEGPKSTPERVPRNGAMSLAQSKADVPIWQWNLASKREK
jgi:hypothetical protein